MGSGDRVPTSPTFSLIYRLEGVKYGKPEYLTKNDTLESRALEGLKIDLREVWA